MGEGLVKVVVPLEAHTRKSLLRTGMESTEKALGMPTMVGRGSGFICVRSEAHQRCYFSGPCTLEGSLSGFGLAG